MTFKVHAHDPSVSKDIDPVYTLTLRDDGDSIDVILLADGKRAAALGWFDADGFTAVAYTAPSGALMAFKAAGIATETDGEGSSYHRVALTDLSEPKAAEMTPDEHLKEAIAGFRKSEKAEPLLDRKERAKIDVAGASLRSSFLWRYTKEGPEFWAYVATRLHQMATT